MSILAAIKLSIADPNNHVDPHSSIYVYENENNTNNYFRYATSIKEDTASAQVDFGQIFSFPNPIDADNISTPVLNVTTGGYFGSTGIRDQLGNDKTESAGAVTFLPAMNAPILTFNSVTGQNSVFYISTLSNYNQEKLYLTYDTRSKMVFFLTLTPRPHHRQSTILLHG